MKFKIQPYAIMEFGSRKDEQGNPHQEDSMYPEMGEATPSDRLFIICDGMGGHEAGEVASATVCEAMSNAVRRLQPDMEGPVTDAMLQEAVSDAYAALDLKDRGGDKKMGTTMTLLSLNPAGATIAHMGDSRVYHIRPGETRDDTEILYRTEDHSLVNELVRLGEMTPEQAATSRQKNVITRAMQPHMERRPRADVYHQDDIKAGDFFYMCTDGMLENMTDDNLRFIFSRQGGDGKAKTDILRKQTTDNNDNHTAFLIEVKEVEGPAAILPGEDHSQFSLLSFPAEKSHAAPAPSPATVGAANAMANQPGVEMPMPPAAPQRPPVKQPQKPGQAPKSGISLVGIVMGLVAVAALVIGCLFLFKSDDKEESVPQGNVIESGVESPDDRYEYSGRPQRVESGSNRPSATQQGNRPNNNRPTNTQQQIQNAVNNAGQNNAAGNSDKENNNSNKPNNNNNKPDRPAQQQQPSQPQPQQPQQQQQQSHPEYTPL